MSSARRELKKKYLKKPAIVRDMESFDVDNHTLKKKTESIWIIEPSGDMKVPVKMFTNEHLLEKISGDGSVQQACNVATLPGIKTASVVLPDQHCGYGFSIGGVAAFDMKEGIISPGGIGFDINCGVRVLATSLTVEDVRPRIKELLEKLYENCPVGVGSEAKIRLSDEDYQDLMRRGAAWAVENGLGTADDLEHCESNGCIAGADPDKTSRRAQKRGRRQLGTVGAGNHFKPMTPAWVATFSAYRFPYLHIVRTAAHMSSSIRILRCNKSSIMSRTTLSLDVAQIVLLCILSGIVASSA